MKYLLVEGITDVALIKYICVKNGITTKFNDFKSEAHLIKPNEIKIDKLAVIQDADSDFEASKEKINQAIKEAKITKEVEIFLTPNNQDIGDLETLLLSTLEQNQIPQLVCFEDYENCLTKHIDVSTKAMDKARVYSYTMFAKEGKDNYTPQNSFMHKKNKKYQDTNLWDIEHPNFQPLVDFVIQIFGEKE
jgi:competence CoiA-like predicted nuclease